MGRPGLDREVGYREVKESESSISSGGDEMVVVTLRPSQVIDNIW